MLAIAGLGGILGVLFSVPLRRALIVDQGLQFPEGVATAEVLKAGDEPGSGVKILGVSRARRRPVRSWPRQRPAPDSRHGGSRHRGFFGKALAFFGTNLSPALLGVGYIVGLNVGALMLSRRHALRGIRDPDLRAFIS